jgi:hypothetical protein
MSDDLFAQSVTYALAPLLARTTHGPSISSLVARIALGDRMGNLLKVHS